MKFVEFNGEVPEIINRRRHDMQCRLKDFMRMNVKVAEVQFDGHDYKNPKTAYECIGIAIKRSELPLKRFMRQGTIYLVRTDMD